MTTLEQRIAPLVARANDALDRFLPPAAQPPMRLHEAMRYAALAPGKRIRPVLVYATGQALGVSLKVLDAAAAAVEFIHAYSLIHDDLPPMDDDDLRRGRPTCHRQFDEATAILAGDALQALAFEALLHDSAGSLSDGCRLAMVQVLAQASGSLGMAGGQALDLSAVGKKLTLAELENMHKHKTGALIRASVKLGLLASGNEDADLDQRLERYATCIGLAFQVQDDILDVEGATEVIGKPQGSDADRDKPTYPNLLGMDQAKATARQLCDDAIASLATLAERGDTLAMIANFIVKRDR
ncbi:MAG: (2E,6E)-farnesyl diphosphate synthase [Gammaproteobacteria bacterium]|nr:(2E,6E)-farnesyl diphosphate synthase [Gammaproteobacteria bacterium]